MPRVELAHQIGGELPGDEGIELRFAMQPLAEIERHFAVPERAVRRQDVEQQLEAGIAQRRAPPAGRHRAGSRRSRSADRRCRGRARSGSAGCRSSTGEAKRTERRSVDALVEAARGADDLGVARADRRDHALRRSRDRAGRRRPCTHSRSPLADSMPWMLALARPRSASRSTRRTRSSLRDDCANDIGGAVGRVVVDEQDFPVEPGSAASARLTTGRCCRASL